MRELAGEVKAGGSCAAAGARGCALARHLGKGYTAALPSPSHEKEARATLKDVENSDTDDGQEETADDSTQFGESAAWSDISSDSSVNVGFDTTSCRASEDDGDGGGGGSGRWSQKRNLRRDGKRDGTLGKPRCREGARRHAKLWRYRVNATGTNVSDANRAGVTGGGAELALGTSKKITDEMVLIKEDGSGSCGGLKVSASSTDDSNTASSLSGDDGGLNSDDEVDPEDPLEPIPGEVKLVPSMFPDRPPTVFFEYPKELGMVRFDNVYFTEPLGGRRLLFKTHWERNSVKNAFYRAGFSRTRSTLSWTACWGKHPTQEGFKNLNRFQKVNHFPGSWCIGRKDRLLRTLARHKRVISGVASVATAAAGGYLKGGVSGNRKTIPMMNNLIDMTPDGFILPGDRRAWLKAVEAEPKAIWIVKPPASSCGRGIRIISKANGAKISKSKKCVVQRYIHNPMLIEGRKFDLRLYVLVTSMEPLRVYLFEEGLVRLSTKRYSLKNLRSRFTHLTNFSINKRSESFQAPDDSDGQEAKESTSASKWALTFFWRYLEETLGKTKSEEVRRSIDDIVLRTMAAADVDMTTNAHQVTRNRGCFYELFGFDVLLDEYLKPWLLEVNISPSLFGSSALDRRIKGTLMADIFHLVGFRPFDRIALRREERNEAQHIPGTRRAVRAPCGKPQDAWRRRQTPANVKLSDLGEDEWEVIRDTEDEKHRAGHFRILYPTAENVIRFWPIFQIPRFLNGVLARWVLTGGLSSLSNRAHIGLAAERLAALGPANFRRRGNASTNGSASSIGRGKDKGLGIRTGKGDDGRWEETTSNATTIINSRGAGPGPCSLPEGSQRPASSATSRASRQDERPSSWRDVTTQTKGTVANGGVMTRVGGGVTGSASSGGGRLDTQKHIEGRVGHDTNRRRGTPNLYGGRSSGGRGVARRKGAARTKTSVEVRVVQLYHAERKVNVGPSMLTGRSPVLPMGENGRGQCSGGVNLSASSASYGENERSAPAPRALQVSWASSSRLSTDRCRGVRVRSRGSGLTAGAIGPVPHVDIGRWHTARQMLPRQSPEAVFLKEERTQRRTAVGGADSIFPKPANLPFHAPGTSTATTLTNVAQEGGAWQFPRQPLLRAARHATEGEVDDSDAPHIFGALPLPSRCSGFAPESGTTASHTLSLVPCRHHDLSDVYNESNARSTASRVTNAPFGSLGDERTVRKVYAIESMATNLQNSPRG